MRRPSLAQLELPLEAQPLEPSVIAPEPAPEPARLCARCGWYCPLTQPCPVCQLPPQSAL